MRLFWSLLLAVVVSLGLLWAWGAQQGYLPYVGVGCSDVGYAPDTPFDVLVEEYGEPAYCAREVRGETWL